MVRAARSAGVAISACVGVVDGCAGVLEVVSAVDEPADAGAASREPGATEVPNAGGGGPDFGAGVWGHIPGTGRGGVCITEAMRDSFVELDLLTLTMSPAHRGRRRLIAAVLVHLIRRMRCKTEEKRKQWYKVIGSALPMSRHGFAK